MANDAEHTWGHTLPFSEEYYRGITELLRQTGDDAEMLAEVAALAAITIGENSDGQHSVPLEEAG